MRWDGEVSGALWREGARYYYWWCSAGSGVFGVAPLSARFGVVVVVVVGTKERIKVRNHAQMQRSREAPAMRCDDDDGGSGRVEERPGKGRTFYYHL